MIEAQQVVSPLAAMKQALEADGYYCVACGRFLPAIDGVIVHDDIEHPIEMDFGDEEKPQ